MSNTPSLDPEASLGARPQAGRLWHLRQRVGRALDAIVAIAAAELRASWSFIPLAALLGIASAVGIGSGGEAQGAEVAVAGFTLIGGLVLGASALGRPLAEGRI